MKPPCILFIALLVPWTGTHAQLVFSDPMPIAPNVARVEQAYVGQTNLDESPEIILGSTAVGQVFTVKVDAGEGTSYDRLIPDDVSSNLMHAADLTGDGILDVVRGRSDIGLGQQGLGIALYAGTSSGTLAAPILAPVADHFKQAWSADLTNDGQPELIARSDDRLVILQYTAGALEVYHDVQGYWSQIAVGDLDLDGTNELVMVRGAQLHIWDPSNGPGTPTTFVDNVAPDPGPMIIADVDQDGLPDILGLVGSSSFASMYRVWSNQGGLLFQRSQDLSLGLSIKAWLRSKDLDGDGLAELIAITGQQAIRLPLNSDLSVGTPDTLTVASAPLRDLTFSDLDLDGLEDLVFITEDDRLQAAGGTSTPAEFQTPELLLQWLPDRLSGFEAFRAGPSGSQVPTWIGNGRTGLTTHYSVPVREPGSLPPITSIDVGSSNWFYANNVRQVQCDVDDDGDDDLLYLVVHWGTFSPCHLFVLENDAGELTDMHCLGNGIAGQFASLSGTPILFDVDGDGSLDLLLDAKWRDPGSPNTTWTEEYWSRQTAPLEFTVQATSLPLPIAHFNIHKDLDQDGFEDLIHQETDGSVTFHRNDGNGQFTTLPPVQAGERLGHTWLDVDQDGITELVGNVVAGDTGIIYYNSVTLGTVGPRHILFQGIGTAQAVDLDKDGDPDVLKDESVPGMLGQHRLEAYWNLGGGNFSGPTFVHQGPEWFEGHVDHDGDGDPDLVLRRNSSIYLIENRSHYSDPPRLAGTNLLVFPNPSTGDIELLLGDDIVHPVRIEITDAAGRAVRSLRSDAYGTVLSVTGLTAGIYLVQAFDQDDGSAIATTKLVVAGH